MDSADEFQYSSLDSRTVHKKHLVTYSQANIILLPISESFEQSAADAFNKGSCKLKVLHWACCLKSHQNGGNHYHCSVKLSGSKRRTAVKDTLIHVHFSDAHDNCLSVFKYITKSNLNIFLSFKHPNMQEMSSPKTGVSAHTHIR